MKQKSKLSKSNFSQHGDYYQSILCVPSLQGFNPDVLCRKWKNHNLSEPLVGTLFVEMIQVYVQLHQLPVCHTTVSASRLLGCTGPLLYNVLADWVPFTKKSQMAHTSEARRPHPGFPSLERHRDISVYKDVIS